MEIVIVVNEDVFDYFDVFVERIVGVDILMFYVENFEKMVFFMVEDIVCVVMCVCYCD